MRRSRRHRHRTPSAGARRRRSRKGSSHSDGSHGRMTRSISPDGPPARRGERTGHSVEVMGKPTLPDGFVAVVKRDCETCQTVVPVAPASSAARPGSPCTRRTTPTSPVIRRPIVRRRPRRQLAPRHRDRADADPRRRRRRDRAHVRLARNRVARRSPASTISARDLPPMRPGCGSKSVDPDLVDELRVRHGGSVLRSRRIEVADAEDDIEMMFTRGMDRRPAGRPADRGTRARDARRARPARPTRSSPPCRPTSSTSTVEKVAIAAGDGRLQARVPAVGPHRGRGGVHRRVQHARAAGHHDAGRTGHRLQRTGHPQDRDELGHQRARPGQPRQLDDRTSAPAVDPQRRWRPTGRGRPCGPRQPGQGRASASPRTTHESPYGTLAGQHGIDGRCRRRHGVRRRGSAGHRRPALPNAGEPRQHARPPAAGDPPPQARDRRSTRSW